MNPYTSLEERAFWAPSVGRREALDIAQLWNPKFHLKRQHKIAAFGSCFAQHFGRALAARGYNWMSTEDAPAGLSEEDAKAYNYGIFTSRTANIYTVSLLRQWAEWALGKSTPPEEYWEKGGRIYDPFRPAIEPGGFASIEEMRASREVTIDAFGRAMRDCNLFVFTMGLTESWFNKIHGYEYPMCPGTIAGTFDESEHEFVNQRYPFIRKNLKEFLRLLREANRKARVLLTVSPVPLTATKSGNHVLVATTESKSTLRAVAGEIADSMAKVDYFPSFEIISSAPFGGRFYEANKRSVRMDGVDHVMKNFFDCMYAKFDPGRLGTGAGEGKAAPGSAEADTDVKTDDDLVCEEEILAAFGDRG